MKTFIMCLMLMGITSAYAYELFVFSMMRLEDKYKNVYPPFWKNNKNLVQKRVNQCVQDILASLEN